MKKYFTLLLILPLFVSLPAGYSITPRPSTVLAGSGDFNLNDTYISATADLASEASYLGGNLAGRGIRPALSESAAKGTIKLTLQPGGAPESYTLTVTPAGVEIKGADNAGVFYGVVSLLHMIDDQGENISAVSVADSPRYPWRGFMLDEARHFFGREKVLQILDLMAYFKLNKFHWHLSDSEGWRIEVKGYPRLAAIGGQGNWSDPGSTEAKYYTQEQIREIVDYAAERHIEVIPEIDMPGHANASNRAYPQYSGGDTEQFGEFTFNPGKEETYEYLTNVLSEIMPLFPTEYMNIGGDEVAFGIESWNTDPDAQALIRREGYTTLRQAEKYFIDRMSDTVRSMGRKLIGWEELVELDTDRGTTILWWRQNKPEVLDKALREGYNVIICPRLPQYLDFIQDGDHKWGRVWVDKYNRLQDVYAFPDSMLDTAGLSDAQLSHIIGMQANLWTERIPTPERLDYMMWPRLCASAEAAWTSPRDKDFADFQRRMDGIYLRLDRLGIHYYDHREPDRTPEIPGREKGSVTRDKPMDFID